MTKSGKKRKVDEQIDDNLKRVYEAAAAEPLPDRFLALLAQLKAREEGAEDDQ